MLQKGEKFGESACEIIFYWRNEDEFLEKIYSVCLSNSFTLPEIIKEIRDIGIFDLVSWL